MVNHEYVKKVGMNIRRERKAVGLNQAELAVLVRTSEFQIQKIEKGHCACQINTLKRIADALGVEVKNLV